MNWAICKSATRSRQITMPVPHHSVFYRPDALPAAQPTASKHWSISVNSPITTCLCCSSEEVQCQRLRERTGYDAAAAQQRISAQLPLADKCRLATVVIDNMGSVGQLQQTVVSVHAWLRSRRTHWKLRLLAASFMFLVTMCFWTLHRLIPIS